MRKNADLIEEWRVQAPREHTRRRDEETQMLKGFPAEHNLHDDGHAYILMPDMRWSNGEEIPLRPRGFAVAQCR